MGGFTGSDDLGSDVETVKTSLTLAKKGVVPVVEYPDGSYKADSTPIMLDLEHRHSGRSIIPAHPAIAFLAYFIEDMCDEYLPFPMFYFRWVEDQQWCGRRQMTGWNGALDDETLERYATNFLNRQQSQLGPLKAMPRESVLENYLRFLDAMEAQLSSSFFLFGTRPSLAEFGLYGQLTQYIADPTVSSILKERAVRTYQWTQFMDDLSGVDEGEWGNLEDCLTGNLKNLITSMAPMYFTMANAMKERVSGIDISKALNGPGYRVKSLLQVKQAFAALDQKNRNLLKLFLESCECWEPLQFLEGEQEQVIALTVG
ncbi:MAG: glutathione S-transferase [Candidatus Azotimanducaceae bacterium]|jgi:glutathione S-transferase